MNKATNIQYTGRTNNSYSAVITLEDGQKFDIWTRNSGQIFSADAVGRQDTKYSDPIWNIDFTKTNIEKHEIFFTDQERNIETVPKEKGTAIQVFAAIEKFVTEWIKSSRPEAIQFESGPTEKSKLKLYTLLAKKISKAGYKHYTYRNDQHLIRKDLIKNDRN